MSRTHAKTLAVMIVLAMTVFCFTGCVRFRTTMSIKGNGKADLAVIYAYHEELIDDDVRESLEEVAESFEDDGWTADDYEKGDYEGYLFSMNNVKVKDFEEVFNANCFEDLDFGEFVLTQSGSTYTIEWETNAIQDVEEEGITSDDLSEYGGFMEVVIELPSPAKDDNATKVSKDGKTLTWNLFEEDDVEVTFTLVNVGAIIAIIAIVAILITAAIVVVLILLLKKKKKPAADGGAAPAAPAAPAPVSNPAPASPIDFSVPIAPAAPVAAAPAVEVPVAPVEPAAPAPEAPADPAT
ncbi:MAG: hypothetical protein K5779_11340 [Saccharofermentans sp.]|nr:hypothetical protein [Saccharofermentans sp.]